MAITVHNAYWSRLSRVFLTFLVYPLYRIDMPSISLYRCIIFNVTFTFWKTWHNDYKCAIPDILCKKLRSTKKIAFSPFPCYITGISRYSSNTFEDADCHIFWMKISFFIKTIILLINLIIKSPKTICTKLYLKKWKMMKQTKI